MRKFQLVEDYDSKLSVQATEIAIKQIKDFFQKDLSSELKLRRVTAPMVVTSGTGINDDLNGVEKPVSFIAPGLGGQRIEVVQSLAKWKRLMLGELEIVQGKGIYTDMNALRPDEELTHIHSIYVDQWDWEKHISKEDRNLDFLKKTVQQIYQSIKRTEFYIEEMYPQVVQILPDEIHFIHTEDLEKEYPELTPQEREDAVAEKYGAVFIIGIGNKLSSGEPHDGRAPDYDDWSTPTLNGYKGLNGDIILWNPVVKHAFEISSMGIRVDRTALAHQLKLTGHEKRAELYFHQKLIKDEIPLSIGGGIGQSRLCMFLLRKAHIGEVQAGLWPKEMKEVCSKKGVTLL